ncbi:MAG: protoporphyrinogen oxidase [Terriglobales bacterium]
MKRIAIVGGGIAGLSAAFYLEQAKRSGAALEYVLYESLERLGGVLRSERVDDCLLEAGPDSFLTEKPWAADLCRDLGLEGELIGSSDHLRRTFILADGRLLALPEGLQFMVPTRIWPIVASPLFSLGTKLRMAREYFSRSRPPEEDESAANLVERHFGGEVLERIADPLLAGVYGGDAERLSARAALPRFVEMEARSGSLTRGLLAARKAATCSAAPRPLFTALRGGMQQMVDALVARLPSAALRASTSVTQLGREGARWLLTFSSGPAESFDSVVLALPAYRAAELLESVSAPLATLLHRIPYNSATTVSLGYDAASLSAAERAAISEGSGFLVPRSEGRSLLACTFVHNKFSGRAPEGRLLLRAFLRDLEGGPTLSDGELVQLVKNDLREILGLAAEPRFARVYRWPAAMAQYEVGHLDRLAEIERLRAELPGLALIGNAYRGIGVPDCIRSGRDAAEEIARSLSLSS